MDPRCEPPGIPERPAANEHRRHGRMKCGALSCELGTVLDVSASGMRVLFPGRLPVAPDDLRPITVRTDWAAVELQVRVAWVRRQAWHRYEIGLEFEHPTEAARHSLFALAFRAGMQTGGLDGLTAVA